MTRFRTASLEDVPALLELERAANLAALGHVFDPDRHPFPEDDVRARWVLVLADDEVRVDVVDAEPPDSEGLLCYVAHDSGTLRHLAVHPRAWGRGLARAAVEHAVHSIRTRGGTPTLWCLVENSRARGLYEHLGWRPTGRSGEAVWPPYPGEMEYEWRPGGAPEPPR